MSSRINEALHQLSNPLKRAEYILAREGYAGGETDKLEDMDLLMEVMEAREGLASADSQEEVEEIRSQNQGARGRSARSLCFALIAPTAKIEETLKEIEQLVAEKDWESLRTAAVKLKYLQGIESAAAAWPAIAHDH